MSTVESSIFLMLPNAAAFYNSDTKENQNNTAKLMGFTPDMESAISDSGTHPVHTLNLLGYIPVVSTFSGTFRTLLALVYLVKSVVGAIFGSLQNRPVHLEGIKIAAANIIRGLFEIVPVIGNLFVINVDVSRMTHRWSEAINVPYADEKTIAAYSVFDELAMIPILGNITSAFRAIFFTFHGLVNIPGLAVNKRGCEAIGFSALEVVTGLWEAIPIIGTLSARFRNCMKEVNKIES